ncbi:MAG: Maf family protein [Spirochaetaceae bacterium]|jgi:septum formation protein|nr:Maf family protein [Spirochaetaceae bacterium]
MNAVEPLILASSSPQRGAILTGLGIPFKTALPQCDETLPEDMSADAAAGYLAERKARSVPGGAGWVLGADTVVVLGGRIYGKPRDESEAARFLGALSGRTHTVYSALALRRGDRVDTRTSATEVTFKTLHEGEIAWYVDTGEWRGAAGGYRIQGRGARFISRIFGSPSGVVGLPIFELYDILVSRGYVFQGQS